MKIKQIKAIYFSISIALALCLCCNPTAYGTNVVPGNKCKVKNETVILNSKKYTCINLGRNLYWDNGSNIKPTQLPAINDLQATGDDKLSNFDFSYQAIYPVLYYQEGVAFLKNINLDETLDSNYGAYSPIHILNQTNFSIDHNELTRLFFGAKKNLHGQALSIAVRVKTSMGFSPWSNGIYFDYSDLDTLNQMSLMNDLMCIAKNGTWDVNTLSCSNEQNPSQ
jgi:hypothetical protein